MELELIELKEKNQIHCAELREHGGDFPGRNVDLRYLVRKAGKEVAFLWYDLFPRADYLSLYTLFVAKRFRRQGIGGELIRRAEALAIARGYKRVIVRPKPLSEEISQEKLIRWYEKRGFSLSSDGNGIYSKNVHP